MRRAVSWQETGEILEKGETRGVGEFPFMCTVWCSQKHMEMNGKIIITE